VLPPPILGCREFAANFAPITIGEPLPTPIARRGIWASCFTIWTSVEPRPCPCGSGRGWRMEASHFQRRTARRCGDDPPSAHNYYRRLLDENRAVAQGFQEKKSLS